MGRKLSSSESAYLPQSQKSFEGALEAFFASEVPQLMGTKTRKLLTQSIKSMVDKFYPVTSHLRAGQIIWPTVHKDEKGAYGKTIGQTRIVPVILDLIQIEDAGERAKGKKLKEMNKEAIARLCHQAHEQNGCLTSAELSLMLKLSATTICNYIAEWEKENGGSLPRRGTVHDLGPTLTHKKEIIVKLFLEQKTVQQVSRETWHSYSAINRYITGFRQVLLCKQKGFTTSETAFTVKMMRHLVRQYEIIIDEFKLKNFVMEDILKVQNEVKGYKACQRT